MNEALRKALIAADLGYVDVAAHLSVDPKTVERWIAGRLPHSRSRAAVARLVGVDEERLWPAVADAKQRGRFGGEVRAVYPHRMAVPREVWLRLFGCAESEICILVYSGLFIAEDSGIRRLLSEKARAGVAVRILLGDPDSAAVGQRGKEECIGDAMTARIHIALTLLSTVADVEGVELRLHGATLYNSIFRADDELLVNPHIYGAAASNAPVLRLRRSGESSMVATYLASFERVWADSREVRGI